MQPLVQVPHAGVSLGELAAGLSETTGNSGIDLVPLLSSIGVSLLITIAVGVAVTRRTTQVR